MVNIHLDFVSVLFPLKTESLSIIFTHFQEFKMCLPKVLVLIAVLLPMALSREDVANRKKRAISYAVEGCFSEFPGVGESKAMGGDNSNVKCQETCRDQGYILAATRDDQCHCGNIYPKGKKVNDSKCIYKCQSWSSACNESQSCCGGPSAYSVSVVGNIDVAKQVLRVANGHRLQELRAVTC